MSREYVWRKLSIDEQLDLDGIKDPLEREYEKWVRSQRPHYEGDE